MCLSVKKFRVKGTVGLENYKRRAELKQEVKDLFRGRWKDAVLLNLVPTILLIIVSIIGIIAVIGAMNLSMDVSAGYPQNYGISYSDNTGTSTGSGIIATLITTGISFTFLDWLRKPELRIQPFKNAFQVFSKKYFLRVVLIYIIVSIFTFLWTLLFIIPGIIKSYSYSQAYFIYKDRMEHSEGEKPSALDCITESRRLMDGHKWEYFILQLSFIGWGLLSLLTLGIGFLWLNPYMNATYAAFYDNLSQNYYGNDEIEVF
ncbi:DUF975 family protein [Carnobacterium mobile]|uniref:DUF975 family protein n=1 Tax=Carnobacterium mobile TaxID=2750 RepID=UPI001D010DF1|nr:DUF975 family protein [Carnobacterium mobile]